MIKSVNGRLYTFGIKLYSATGEQLDISSALNVILPEGRTPTLSENGEYLMFEIKENETAIIKGLKEGQYIRIAEKDIYFNAFYYDEEGNRIEGLVRYGAVFSNHSKGSVGGDPYPRQDLGIAGLDPWTNRYISYVTATNSGPAPNSAFVASFSGWEML